MAYLFRQITLSSGQFAVAKLNCMRNKNDKKGPATQNNIPFVDSIVTIVNIKIIMVTMGGMTSLTTDYVIQNVSVHANLQVKRITII